MTDSNWNPDDYLFDFPDVPRYEGRLVGMPLHHKMAKVMHFLVHDILPEARRCLEAGAELGALLLALSVVDYLAGYLAGRNSKREDFLAFMRRYFPEQYHPFVEDIYEQLRCGLMHNLSVRNPWKGSGRTSFLVHPHSRDHLQTMESGETVFSVLIFLEDIRRAWWMYAHDLIMRSQENPGIVEAFTRRFNRLDGQGAFMLKVQD